MNDFAHWLVAAAGLQIANWISPAVFPAQICEWRQSNPKVSDLVGTPKGRLLQLEQELAAQSWPALRPRLRVKRRSPDGEVHVPAQSGGCTHKERAGRQRKFKDALWCGCSHVRRALF